MPDHDAFRPDGRLNIPSQAAADYIAREGTLQPYEPTMREKAESAIAGALKNLGMSKSSARDSAVGFTGTTDSSRGGLGVGVLDFFPPFSIPTAGQEVSREVKGLMNNPDTTATDYISPALTAVLTGVEAIPATKLATKPLKGFINNLAAKADLPVSKSKTFESPSDFFEIMGDDGAGAEFPQIGKALDDYVYEMNREGILRALKSDDYPEYQKVLRINLDRLSTENKIPVSRIENYLDPMAGIEGRRTKRFFDVDKDDVLFVGSDAERELIVKGSDGSPMSVRFESPDLPASRDF